MERYVHPDAENQLLKSLIQEVEAQRPDRVPRVEVIGNPCEIEERLMRTIGAEYTPPKERPWFMRLRGVSPAPSEMREYVTHFDTGLLNMDGHPIYRVKRMSV